MVDVTNIENKYGSLIIDGGRKSTLGLQSFAEYFRQLTGCIYITQASAICRRSKFKKQYLEAVLYRL